MSHDQSALGQLDDLMGREGAGVGNDWLPTGTGRRHDLDHLGWLQQGRAMAWMPGPGTWGALPLTHRRRFRLRGIGGGGTIGVARGALQPGFQRGDPRLKRPHPCCWWLDDRQQLDDRLLDDDRRLFPAGGVTWQPCGPWDRSHHSGHPRGKHLVSLWGGNAALIAQNPGDFQQKIEDDPCAVTLHLYPLNPHGSCSVQPWVSRR
jgi:hypothetical protein